MMLVLAKDPVTKVEPARVEAVEMGANLIASLPFQEPVAPLLDREPIPVTGLDPVEAEPVVREAKP